MTGVHLPRGGALGLSHEYSWEDERIFFSIFYFNKQDTSILGYE